MKKRLRGLIITYCYPPYNSPEAYVTYKLLNSLSRFCDITLLKPSYNNLEDTKLKNNFRIIDVNIPFFIDHLLNFKRLPIRPDRFIFYYPIFKKKLLTINIKDYDFVMTRSQFHSTHLLGLLLKKMYDIKWLAHFSDPWHKNPVQKNVPIFDSLSRYWQNRVLKNSDLNTFPLNNLMNFFNDQSSINIKKKSIIIPHSLLEFKKIEKLPKSFVIRYFGKIYAGRKIKNTLVALTNIIKKYDKVGVEFFVDQDFFDNYKNYINNFDKIKFYKYLDFDKYFERLNQSSILILIDIDEAYGNLFFQSKLVDYLQTQKPILHIGRSKTYNKKIILENNGISCLNDSIQIYNSVEYIIKNIRKFKYNKSLIDSFSSKTVASKLFQNIKKIVNSDN